MARLIDPEGDCPCPLLILTDRPNWEDVREGRPFAGIAGAELWSRFDRLGLPDRRSWYTTFLVRSFSDDPVLPDDVLRSARTLRAELAAVQPRLIVTCGPAALRWFLPGADLDTVHGLPHVSPRTDALVVPIVSPGAALKQPERFQHVFTEDIRALRSLVFRALDDRPLHPHRAQPPTLIRQPHLHDAHTLAFDTEGTVRDPECLTVSNGTVTDLLLGHERQAMLAYLDVAHRLIGHNLPHDLQVLRTWNLRDLDLTDLQWHDTMLQAYLLGEFAQGLKPLAYRRLRLQLSDYADLIKPLDDARVRATLQGWFDVNSRKLADHDRQLALAKRFARQAAKAAKADAQAARRAAGSRRRHATARHSGAAASERHATAGDRSPAHAGESATATDPPDARSRAQRDRRDPQLGKHAGRLHARDAADRAHDHAGSDASGERHRRGSEIQLRRAEGAESISIQRLEAVADRTRVVDAAHPGVADLPARRALTSVRGILTRSGDKSIRARWSASKFADACPLPPEATWRTFLDVDRPHAEAYALADAFATRGLFDQFLPALRRQGLWRAYAIDRAVLPMIARMESVGMRVQADTLQAIGHELGAAYNQVCATITDTLGYSLNPKAAEDVSEVLFDDLGITPTKLTRGGKYYTTGDKYLEARKHEHAVVPLIIQGRELWKLKSSYADKLPGMLRDGRYYPDFSYTRTASGRLAETIILLIPKHSTWGKRIRKAFVADDGHALVSCDLSQIELRVLADLSQDRELIRAYREGRDLHAETAHSLLGAPRNKVDQDEAKHRLPAKKGNFGAFMGLSPGGLTEQIRAGGNRHWAAGCPACDAPGPGVEHLRDCESVIFFREYFRKYTGIRRYIDTKHAEAQRDGYVRDAFGAMIRVPGVWSMSQQVVRRSLRMAQATPVQATADRISKLWMANVWRDILLPARGRWYAEPWSRVHDDTILEVDARKAKSVARRMLALVPQTLAVQTSAEAKIGPNWGELT